MPALALADAGSRLLLVLEFALEPLALAQIVVGGARVRPRLGVGIEVLFGDRCNAAVLAHLEDVEAPRRALKHPVLALELGGDPLDGALHAERLAADDAGKRLLRLGGARRRGGGAEVELGPEGDDLRGTGRLAQAAV